MQLNKIPKKPDNLLKSVFIVIKNKFVADRLNYIHDRNLIDHQQEL